MSELRRWSREELLVVLNLYEKLHFGQFHSRQPVIIEVSEKMQRTPGSLAMKLSNLASLDSKLQARGIAGLQGASNLDKAVWTEFHENRNAMVPASEEAMRELFDAREQEDVEVIADEGVKIQPVSPPLDGSTSAISEVTVRRGQQYFRQAVLNAFGSCCGITGIAIRELLVASHILPWARYPKSRLEPQNGIALSRLHDGAFDRGLISFDDNYRLVLSDRLRSHLPQKSLDENFVAYEGKVLGVLPDALPPSLEYLSVHRKEWDLD